MRPIELVYRGNHQADGFVLDTSSIGEDEARRRVLQLWSPSSRLYRLPTGQWLYLLDTPVDVRAPDSPGVVVKKHETGLAASVDLEPGPREFSWWHHGVAQQCAVDGLEPLDPSTWIDLDCSTVVLEPLVATNGVEPSEPASAPPPPDLRSAARVGAPARTAAKFAEELRYTEAARARRGQGHGRGAASRRTPVSSFLSRVALRTPLRHEVGRRHARYLENLSRQFHSRDFNEALRHAIPIGGLGAGALTLRLPARRADLKLSPAGASGSRVVPFGPSVQHHLQALYRQAATELESAGKLDEAAFVLAELLNNPAECVALLERHKRYETAATLAENRELLPALVARLWWLAGDRQRALRIARRESVHAVVIDRLAEIDARAAHELRLHWVDELEGSGNLIGAVDAGWPDPEIRPLLHSAIERGIAAETDQAINLHPYRIALNPSEPNRRALIDVLARDDLRPVDLRALTVATSNAECSDPVADRELTTRIVRSVAASPWSKDAGFARAFRAIRDRADPLLAADLPPGAPHASRTEPVVIPAQPPGLTAIHDAAPLPRGAALVALGELGCRIVTPDGRTASHWDIPTDHLVMADHGGSALLLSRRSESIEVHFLELTTRKPRHYGTIRADLWADSFDGAGWPAVDKRGLAFYDLLADHPAVAWRELDPSSTCHRLERTTDSLAVLGTVEPDATVREQRLELWRWELPAMRLAARGRIEAPEAIAVDLLADATSLWTLEGDEPVPPTVITVDGTRSTTSVRAGTLRTSGRYLAVCDQDGSLAITDGPGDEIIATAQIDPGRWGFRAHGNRIATWDDTGRFAVVDVESRNLLTAARIT